MVFDVTAKLDEQSECDKPFSICEFILICAANNIDLHREGIVDAQGLKNMVAEFSTGFPEADHPRGLGGGPETIVLR